MYQDTLAKVFKIIRVSARIERKTTRDAPSPMAFCEDNDDFLLLYIVAFIKHE